MLKQIAWNTFKNTGNIDTFMELLEVDKVMESKADNIMSTKENKLIKNENNIKKL